MSVLSAVNELGTLRKHSARVSKSLNLWPKKLVRRQISVHKSNPRDLQSEPFAICPMIRDRNVKTDSAESHCSNCLGCQVERNELEDSLHCMNDSGIGIIFRSLSRS